MNRLTRYALGLIVEEMGEALQWIGKAMRFGIDTPGPDGETARHGLGRELGDVNAAITYGSLADAFDGPAFLDSGVSKIEKLTDPASRDNLGRRLAPDTHSDPALEASELLRAIGDPGHLAGPRGERTLAEWQRDAVLAHLEGARTPEEVEAQRARRMHQGA